MLHILFERNEHLWGHSLTNEPLEDIWDFRLPYFSYDLLLLGGSVGWPTSEKNQNSVAFNPILLNNITF